MSQGSEAAEQMTREALQISEAAVKLSALGAKNLAALCLALANENQKLAGKTNMTRLLKSGKELRVFDVRETDLGSFAAAARQYGVLFTVIKNSRDGSGNVDVLTRAEDVSKINRILEKMQYPVLAQEQEEHAAKKAAPRAPSANRSDGHGTGLKQETAARTTEPVTVREKLRQIKERQGGLQQGPTLPGKEKSR